MLGGNIDVSFPKNLRDPMNADLAPVRFQDFALAFSKGASRLAFRPRTRRRPRPRMPSADRILDRMNPRPYITINTAAFLLVKFVR